MNARTKRLLLDILLVVIVNILLIYVMAFIAPYTYGLDIALVIIPVVWIALRHGVPTGIIAGLLSGAALGILEENISNWDTIILVHTLPLLLTGTAGIFAKYTQKTLNNGRYSSTYLNIFTASLTAGLLYYVTKHWLAPLALNTDSVLVITSANFWLSLGITWLLSSLVLSGMARMQPSLIIPKRTKFLSRKETSSLLN